MTNSGIWLNTSSNRSFSLRPHCSNCTTGQVKLYQSASKCPNTARYTLEFDSNGDVVLRQVRRDTQQSTRAVDQYGRELRQADRAQDQLTSSVRQTTQRALPGLHGRGLKISLFMKFHGA